MDIQIKKNQEFKLPLAKKYVEEDINIITEVDDYAFKSLVDGTITRITKQDLAGITSIRDYAFYGCKITEAELPNTITAMGRNCFQNNLFEEFVVPDSVITMSLYIFQGCTNLKKVTIGKNVTGFGNGVFDGCTGLTYIEVPDSVKSISWYVFQRCSNLKKLKIGTGVTSISGCFNGCNSLKEIICLAEKPPKFDAQNLNQLPADCIFKVPANSVEAYKIATNWSARADYIVAYEEE